MVRVRHTVLLHAVPRSWCESVLAVLAGLADDSRAEDGRIRLPGGNVVPDVRLVEGRHLRTGAVYAVTDDDGETAHVTLQEWNRRRALRAEARLVTGDGEFGLRTTLRSADRPRHLRIDGFARLDGTGPALSVGSALSALDGTLRLRLDDWWAAADGKRGAAAVPLGARLTHRLFRAELRAAPRPRDYGDQWDVRVTVILRGRGLLRPLAAVLLRLLHGRLRRSVVRSVDEFAAGWNQRVPKALAHDPAGLRETLTAER